MYSVHAVVFKTLNGATTRHEVLIHDNMSPIHEQHLIDPKLKLADLDAGSFTAVIPPYNPGYSLVERFISIIKIHKGTNLIWTGRVITETMDFWNRRSITCEGALAFLNDTVQPIAFYGNGRSPAYILAKLLEVHNSKVVEDRKLYVGAVSDFPENDYEAYIFQTNNGTTMEELKNNLTNRIDCHMSMHYTNGKAYIDIFRDYPNVAPQQINFGDNLLDFTRDWNLSGLTTVILPRGKALDAETNEGQKTYLNLKSTTDEFDPISDGTYSIGSNENAITVDGLYIVNNVLYSQYGRVEKIVDFSDSDNPHDLFIMAKNYLAGMQFDDMTLKVSAIDLHYLTNDIVSFNLLDQVYCISKPHGLYGQFFPIVEIDIPLDHPENMTYTMSNNLQKNTMTGVFGAFKSSVSAAFKGLTTTGHILDLARVEASEILNRKTTGYVNVINMHENEEEGVAQAIVVSSTPNWRESNKYWIWNMNGLGYYDSENSARIAENAASAGVLPSNTTSDGTVDSSTRYYSMAITMDGTIVADRVKTGVLSDGYGFNYWNLETGEFRLMPGAKFFYGYGNDEYKTSIGLISDTEEALNQRTGSANYLNGTKNWANWKISGSWRKSDNDEELMISGPNQSISWNDCLICPNKNIFYKDIKGYTMTFSIEVTSNEEWGEVSTDNGLVVSFALVDTNSSTRYAKMDKVFTIDVNWSRRYVTIELLDTNFDSLINSTSNYESAYLEISLYNRSTHEVTVRRAQFERGNTPTDWSISEADIDIEALNKANRAANSVRSEVQDSLEDMAVDITEVVRKKVEDMNKLGNEFNSKIKTAETLTDTQIKAFDAELNSSKILHKLTNGGVYKLIYFDPNENQLLINADYIQSGAIKAEVIRTGWLSDSLGKNRWNLETGYFETSDAVLKNATVTGQFATTSAYDNTFAVEIDNGSIRFFGPRGECGRIFSTNMFGRDDMMLQTGRLLLTADSLELYYQGRLAKGYNGRVSFGFVQNVFSDGDNIRCEFGVLNIGVTNGLITELGGADIEFLNY